MGWSGDDDDDDDHDDDDDDINGDDGDYDDDYHDGSTNLNDHQRPFPKQRFLLSGQAAVWKCLDSGRSLIPVRSLIIHHAEPGQRVGTVKHWSVRHRDGDHKSLQVGGVHAPICRDGETVTQVNDHSAKFARLAWERL